MPDAARPLVLVAVVVALVVLLAVVLPAEALAAAQPEAELRRVVQPRLPRADNRCLANPSDLSRETPSGIPGGVLVFLLDFASCWHHRIIPMRPRSGSSFGWLALMAAALTLSSVLLQAQAPAGGEPAPAARAGGGGGGGGRGGGTPFGELRAGGGGGGGRANVTPLAVTDKHRTVIDQISLDSNKEVTALDQANTALVNAIFATTRNEDEIRAKNAAVAEAQLKWALKVSNLFATVQAGSDRLPPAAIDQLLGVGGGRGGRGGGGGGAGAAGAAPAAPRGQ